MVRKLRVRFLGDSRFPRASGDGPDIKPVKFGTATFPPRERGWSLHGKPVPHV